ncbi:uncharacterized protein LOC106764543 [Vigna radiata var. radiata]|uniref:Uncharacterized protein LOC106764543 n=1 Tax=Vigna radiata var. radiata TaxID=3916 RepID=A0A1S3UEC9_VIGRR|nr:uncharacterized protein LOC106764543 [Vigna radiata var. radiata]
MKTFNKFEVVMLFVLALLLGITPLLPSSLRPTFLYFIFNVLIIALGAEAGLLSVFSKPLEDTKQHVSVTQKPVTLPEEEKEEKEEAFNITGGSGASDHIEMKAKVVEVLAFDASDEKIVGVSEVTNLLIIGGGENEQIDEQELFAKAEAFIGNFYKQLKMQKEIYQEAF